MEKEQIVEAALLAAALFLAIQLELAVAQRLDRFPMAPCFGEECQLSSNLFFLRSELLPELLRVEFLACQAKIGELQIRAGKSGAHRIGARKRGNLLQSLVALRRNRLLDGKLEELRVMPQAQQFALFYLFQCGAEPEKSCEGETEGHSYQTRVADHSYRIIIVKIIEPAADVALKMSFSLREPVTP